MKESIYYVKGMHCASCEILIEKKLLERKEIKSAEASLGKGEVMIEHDGSAPAAEELNKFFEKEGYIFSADPPVAKNSFDAKNIFAAIIVFLAVVIAVIILRNSNLPAWVSVNSKSSLPAFFVFGLMAGVSSCAALVGGLVLSMSKQWSGYQPHFSFNLGRIFSYALFGAALGLIGNKIQLSFTYSSFLIIAVSALMFFLGLQMLGVKVLQKFQIAMPRFLTRYAANENNFKGRGMPFLMGAMTFFLPCGFTITAQGLALLSGSAVQGGLIMFLFALGTLPTLIFIGFSSVKLLSKPGLSQIFTKVAGVLVLFFALYNFNSQLNLLGAASLSDINIGGNRPSAISNQNIGQDEVQLIKMTASSAGYEPDYFKVRAGTPVRWEIEAKDVSGCTNAVISRKLFAGEINLIPGEIAVKDFTPQAPGRYKFSCWMGMVSGIIEVTD